MTRTDLDRWFLQEDGVAVLWRPSGLLRRIREVPQGARGLRIDGGDELEEGGSPLDGETVLVRATDVPVVVKIPELADRDLLRGTLKVSLAIAPPETRVAALLLRDHFLIKHPQLNAGDLAERLVPILRSALAPRIPEMQWDGDDGFLAWLRGGSTVAEILDEVLFEWGFQLRRVVEITVDSETVRARREREAELREEADRIRRRLEFLELWKKEETGEALARSEVEKIKSHLEREGMLRKVEDSKEALQHRIEAERESAQEMGRLRRLLERERLATQMEIDEERLSYEVDRAKKLQAALEKSGLVGAISSVEDTASRERLLELLIQKEMSPDQIAARQRQQDLRDLEQKIESVSGELMAALKGGRPPEWYDRVPPIRRIWLAAGLALYRVDGDAAFQGKAPTPVLPPEDLGYLRSVRAVDDAAEPVILVGAQGGVLRYQPRDSVWQAYRFSPAPRGRGGANSVAVAGPKVFATHSELGLHFWNGASAISMPLYPERIAAGRSTRGVLLGPEGKMYLSHGSLVLAFDPSCPGQDLQTCGVLPESVTALAASGDTLLAGTRGGEIFRWQPGSEWEALPYRSGGPVFQIVPCAEGWIVGARETAVHVLSDAGKLLAEYRSRYPIRWVGAGRQGILGVDRFGQHLLLWEWDEPRAPRQRIRVPDQIQYLAVERGES